MKKSTKIALSSVLVVSFLLVGYDTVHFLQGPTLTDGSITVNNGPLRVGLGSTPDVTPGSDDLFVEGTMEVDGASRMDGNVDINATLDVSGISTLNGNVDLNANLDVSGTLTFATGAISAADITDNVGTIQLPLFSWRTDADPPLAVVAGTTPNTATEGNFDTYEWITGETSQKITRGFVVPQDFVSGMELHGTCFLDIAAENTADTVGLDWYNAAAGGSDAPTVVDEGVGTTIAAVALAGVVIAMDGATPVIGDSVRLVFGFEAIDQAIHCSHFWIEYTKTQ